MLCFGILTLYRQDMTPVKKKYWKYPSIAIKLGGADLPPPHKVRFVKKAIRDRVKYFFTFFHNLFMTCSGVVNDPFTTFSQCFHNLFRTFKQHVQKFVHDLLTTCALLVPDMFTPWSKLVRNLFATCSELFMTCCKTCSQLPHDFFQN